VIKPYREGRSQYWFRTPDEMMAAQIIKPAVFTRTEKMYVDINTNPGPTYGDAMFWPANWNDVWRTRGQSPQWNAGPPPVAGLVEVIMEVDHDAFKELFVDLMTRPVRRA
jgi:inosine-uridine nucleoside N-ribohydrolase